MRKTTSEGGKAAKKVCQTGILAREVPDLVSEILNKWAHPNQQIAAKAVFSLLVSDIVSE